MPYIDLKIWENQNDYKIELSVLVEAIFLPFESNNLYDQDTIRKITKIYAESVMNINKLEYLKNQAFSKL